MVQSWLTSTTLGANVENLTLLGAGTSNGYGNALMNEITGSVWNNYLDGGDATDWLWDNLGDDTVRGGLGNDLVSGGLGNDLVYGDDGDDAVEGGEGNDLIRGEGGADTLYGDTGADQFTYATAAESTVAGFDRIMDFVRGMDKIDLSAIDTNSAVAGNQAFNWTGAQPFFASPADLYFRSSLIGSVVEGDLNGNKIADFRVVVVGVYDMSAADFVL